MWPAPTPRKKTIATETDTEKKHGNGARGETSQETEEMKGGSQTRLGADISMADLLTPKYKMRWTPAGNRRRGRPKETWRMSVEREMKALGWSWGQVEKLAADRTRWRNSVSALCASTHEED